MQKQSLFLDWWHSSILIQQSWQDSSSLHKHCCIWCLPLFCKMLGLRSNHVQTSGVQRVVNWSNNTIDLLKPNSKWRLLLANLTLDWIWKIDVIGIDNWFLHEILLISSCSIRDGKQSQWVPNCTNNDYNWAPSDINDLLQLHFLLKDLSFHCCKKRYEDLLIDTVDSIRNTVFRPTQINAIRIVKDKLAIW